jgi:hypothetical protein
MGDGSPAIRVVLSDGSWSVGHWRSLVVVAWRGITTLDRAQRLNALMAEVCAAHPAVGILLVIEPMATPPGPDTRPLFAAAMRQHGAKMKGVAYAVLTGGFSGAAVRSAITAISFVARAPYPTRTFSSVDDAATWLASRLAPELTQAQIQAAAATVRDAPQA